MDSGDSCAVGGASGGKTGTRAIFLSSTYGTSSRAALFEAFMRCSTSEGHPEVVITCFLCVGLSQLFV